MPTLYEDEEVERSHSPSPKGRAKASETVADRAAELEAEGLPLDAAVAIARQEAGQGAKAQDAYRHVDQNITAREQRSDDREQRQQRWDAQTNPQFAALQARQKEVDQARRAGRTPLELTLEDSARLYSGKTEREQAAKQVQLDKNLEALAALREAFAKRVAELEAGGLPLQAAVDQASDEMRKDSKTTLREEALTGRISPDKAAAAQAELRRLEEQERLLPQIAQWGPSFAAEAIEQLQNRPEQYQIPTVGTEDLIGKLAPGTTIFAGGYQVKVLNPTPDAREINVVIRTPQGTEIPTTVTPNKYSGMGPGGFWSRRDVPAWVPDEKIRTKRSAGELTIGDLVHEAVHVADREKIGPGLVRTPLWALKNLYDKIDPRDIVEGPANLVSDTYSKPHQPQQFFATYQPPQPAPRQPEPPLPPEPSPLREGVIAGPPSAGLTEETAITAGLGGGATAPQSSPSLGYSPEPIQAEDPTGWVDALARRQAAEDARRRAEADAELYASLY